MLNKDLIWNRLMLSCMYGLRRRISDMPVLLYTHMHTHTLANSESQFSKEYLAIDSTFCMGISSVESIPVYIYTPSLK
jgi:hypothetical protein